MQKLVTGLMLGLLGSVAGIACGSDSRSPEESPSVAAVTATPVLTPERPPTELAGIATEFALGGAFNTTDEAEQMVGYRLLRPDPSIIDTSVAPGRQGGLVDVFPEIGLPRARQAYTLVGKRDYIDFTQEPATYPISAGQGQVTVVTFGAFEGELEEVGNTVSFQFSTGERIDGVPITGLVVALQGYSRDDIQTFVESLAFR